MFAVSKTIELMALIKSISGIRGTIGGRPGNTLSPLDVVKFTAAYGTWLKSQNTEKTTIGNQKVVIGRDGRISGELVQRLVISTLNALAIDVIDLGLSTTPTVEMAVVFENASGGIILTASHNPKEWNALKLLNQFGEFISGDDGAKILAIAEAEAPISLRSAAPRSRSIFPSQIPMLRAIVSHTASLSVSSRTF